MATKAGLSPGAASAAVKHVDESNIDSAAVEKRLEELLSADSSPQSLVNTLKADAAQLRKKRNAVAKELKNAQKRTKRIRERAKQLSDADLVAVLRMRTERKVGDSRGDDNISPEEAPENSPVADVTPVASDGDKKMDHVPEILRNSGSLPALASDSDQT